MWRNRSPESIVAVGLLITTTLTACTDDVAGPQFASDPRPSRVPTESNIVALPSPRPAATPVAVATPASIGDLLSARGAPSATFTATGTTVWAIPVNGDGEKIFEAPAGSRVLAIDAGPSARQVAVLVASHDASDQAELLLLDRTGRLAKRIIGFGREQATPVRSALPGVNVVDWSPQGDRILVEFADGSLFDVRTVGEGAPQRLHIPVDADRILEPAWSPTGETIAFISASRDSTSRALRLYQPADGKISEIVPSANGRFVVDFVWMPDGVSLLFTEGGELAGAVSGIDLWRIDEDGKNRSLMVSAGTVAPVARIATMRPSPDGRSVAYAALVPGQDRPRVDSVWVRDIASGVGFRIEMPSVDAVQDVWWTEQGLVIAVTAGSSAYAATTVLVLLRVKPDGTADVLWAVPLGAATPVATPAATPVDA